MDAATGKTFYLTFEDKTPIKSGKFLEKMTLSTYMSSRLIMRSEKAVFLGSTNNEPMNKPRVDGSLVGSIAEAFANHYHLEIRPDDVWLTISIVFANYVSQYSEEMKECFATNNFSPKIEVKGNIPNPSINEWMLIIDAFVQGINENINKAPMWMIPDFSTTTEKDRFIGNLSIMGAVKRFVGYGYSVSCGIPSVTLHGERSDWVKLLEKIEHINQCGQQARRQDLIDWYRVLKPVLQKFLDSYDGRVDNDFWQDCVVPGRGYGEFDYVCGWALAFSPFVEGRWRLYHPEYIFETKQYGKVLFTDFNGGHSIEVPIKMRGLVSRNMIFYAGGLLCKYDDSTNIISPSFDVVVLEVTDDVMTKKTKSIALPNDKNKDNTRPPFNTTILAEHFNLPRSITVGWHKHPLFIEQTFRQRHTCNVCRNPLFELPKDGGPHRITAEMQAPDYFNITYVKYQCAYPKCSAYCCVECSKRYTH